MKRTALFVGAASMLLPVTAAAQDPIGSAMSAAPASISADAAVMAWDFNQLREGTNGWTCLPDNLNTPGTDPWCVTGAWLNFLAAYVNKTEPTYTDIGFAYMLQGDTPVSNSDPYATEPTGREDWVTDLGPHLMMLVPDATMLEGISTDHLNGGPWIMWPGTSYSHIMIPLESRGGSPAKAASAGPGTVSYVPVPGFPKGADFSIVYGDPGAGAFEMYFRLQPGVRVPMHFHTSAERAVGVQGVITMEYEDGSTMTIGPGTYTFIPWKLPHAASCPTEGSPCIAYFYFDKAFDVTWVEDPPADPNPMP